MKVKRLYNSTSIQKKKPTHTLCADKFSSLFIDLLKWNFRLVCPKNGFSNFLDFLYIAWLSRYKITIEIDFFHQWRKTSGCRACNVQV